MSRQLQAVDPGGMPAPLRLRRALQLRRPLLVAVSAALIVVSLAAIGVWAWSSALANRARTRRLVDLAKREFSELVSMESRTLGLLVDRVQARSDLLAAWQAGDIERLLHEALPLLEEFQETAQITHFYFMDTNCVCRLRVHNPPRRGDLITRVTMQQAAEEGRSSAGLETGPLGTFTLRYVRPWRKDGKRVGYLELGKEIEHLAPALAATLRCDLVLVLDKSATTQEKFNNGRELLGLSGTWDAFDSVVVLNQTISYLPEHSQEILTGTASDKLSTLRSGSRRWMCGTLPIPDATGREVAQLVVLRDSTGDWMAAARDGLIPMGLLLGVGALMLAAVGVSAGRAEARLAAAVQEREQAVEELRASEDAYRAVCTNIPGMVYSLRKDGSIEFACNMESLCGTQADALVSGSLGWNDIVHPDDLEDLRQTAETLAARPLSLAQEYRIVAADGTVRWVSDHKSSRFNAHGEMDGFDGVVLDVTERKQAEEWLTRSEALYRTLFEGAAEGIVVADSETQRFRHANPAICKMLGYAAAEIAGMDIRKIHPEERLPDVSAAFEAQVNGELRPAPEVPCLQKNGEIVYADINTAHIELDGRPHLVGFFNDVTERRRATEEQRRTHQILDGILSSIPVRVFWKDRNLVYLGCNRAFAHDAGLTGPEDIVGKDDFQMGWHDQAEQYRADDMSVITGGHPRLLMEEPQTTPEGDTIWLLTSKVPLRGSEGEILGVVGTYMDITDRKRAETERLQLGKKLQDKQKLAAVGMLACGVGHEINNPIMGVINYAQLIKERVEGKDAALEEFAAEIGIEAERVAGIIRSLTAFATRHFAPHVPTAVGDLVESAVAAICDTLVRDEITLEVDLPDGLPTITCDRAQIEQVLASLMDNARDALNERYPSLDSNKTIRITARTTSDCEDSGSPTFHNPESVVRISVEDHGTGIPPEVREHIFEPFYTTKDRSVGAGNIGKGLGLFVSYAVVQEHGGVLGVESEAGNWTRFHVDLPVAAAAQTPRSGMPSAEGKMSDMGKENA